METDRLVDFLNETLRIDEIEDVSLNGLQVSNSGKVQKVALAVDASYGSFKKAAEADADLLIVHHGLFWDKPIAVTGAMYRRIKILIDSDTALYAAHLPLDLHDKLGNNACIQDVLGWQVCGDFGEYHGIIIGKEVCFSDNITLEHLIKDLAAKLHCKPLVWAFGKKFVKSAGYVSGGGIDLLQEAIDKNMDVFITGEPKHSLYWTAKEAGINVVFAGHYATETLGVKALGNIITEKFNIDCQFIELPTGL